MPPHFFKWILSNFKLFAECDRLGPLNSSVISPQPQTERARWRNIKTPAAKLNLPTRVPELQQHTIRWSLKTHGYCKEDYNSASSKG